MAITCDVSINDTEYKAAHILGFWNGFAVVALDRENYSNLRTALLADVENNLCDYSDYSDYLDLKPDASGMIKIPAGLCFECEPVRLPILSHNVKPPELIAYFQTLKDLDLIYHIDDTPADIWWGASVSPLEKQIIVSNHEIFRGADHIAEPWDYMPDI